MAIQHIFRTGENENLLYAWFSAMHTRVDLVIVHPAIETSLLYLVQRIEKRIVEIENLANCYNANSELSRYNASTLQYNELSTELQHIISLCNEWKQRTNGLFDVAYAGTINLSGFLKGYALDAVHTLLQQEGITTALVNLGNSSILALGNAPGSSNGWMIKNSAQQGFVLKNECLTTSGNNTATHCHIINPHTKQMITGQRLVSVITQTGIEGEVTATVKFITENN